MVPQSILDASLARTGGGAVQPALPAAAPGGTPAAPPATSLAQVTPAPTAISPRPGLGAGGLFGDEDQFRTHFFGPHGVGYRLPVAALADDQILSDPFSPPYVGPLSLDNYGANTVIETAEMRRTYRELYRREPAVRAAVKGKSDAVACLDVSVVPQDPHNDWDCQAAEFVDWTVKNTLMGWDGLITNIVTPALIDGWAVLEKSLIPVDPERSRKWANKWGLLHCRSLDSAYIRLKLDTYRNVLSVVNTVRGLQYYNVDKVILFSYSSLWNNPFGQSDLRAVIRSAALIQDAYQLWYLALKQFGMPYLHGKVSSGAQRAMMEDALAALRAGGYAVTGVEDDIALLSLASATSFAAFEANVNKMREDIFLAVRSAYLPFMEGQGGPDARGDTEVSKVASDANSDLLAKAVARVLTHQLVPWLVRDNFPPGTGYPTVVIGGANLESTRKQLEIALLLAKDFGQPLSKDQLYERANWSPPDGAEDTVDINAIQLQMEAKQQQIEMQGQMQMAQMQAQMQMQQQAQQAGHQQQLEAAKGQTQQQIAAAKAQQQAQAGDSSSTQQGGDDGSEFELGDPRQFSEGAAPKGSNKAIEIVRKAFADLPEDHRDGLNVYAHPDGPKFWIDQMDWHEGDGGKVVIGAAEKAAKKKSVDGYKFRSKDGEGHHFPKGPGVYVFNESSPPGDGWIDLTERQFSDRPVTPARFAELARDLLADLGPVRAFADPSPEPPTGGVGRASGGPLRPGGSMPPVDPAARERTAFEANIDAEPHEASNHLVYADWLDEHGDHAEAKFRRAMGQWLPRGLHEVANLRSDLPGSPRRRHWLLDEGKEGPGGFVAGPKTIPERAVSETSSPANTYDVPPEAWERHYARNDAPWVWSYGALQWPNYRSMENDLRAAFHVHLATHPEADTFADPEQWKRLERHPGTGRFLKPGTHPEAVPTVPDGPRTPKKPKPDTFAGPEPAPVPGNVVGPPEHEVGDFHDHLVHHPEDRVGAGIYADFLQEQGKDAHADVVRGHAEEHSGGGTQRTAYTPQELARYTPGQFYVSAADVVTPGGSVHLSQRSTAKHSAAPNATHLFHWGKYFQTPAERNTFLDRLRSEGALEEPGIMHGAGLQPGGGLGGPGEMDENPDHAEHFATGSAGSSGSGGGAGGYKVVTPTKPGPAQPKAKTAVPTPAPAQPKPTAGDELPTEPAWEKAAPKTASERLKDHRGRATPPPIPPTADRAPKPPPIPPTADRDTAPPLPVAERVSPDEAEPGAPLVAPSLGLPGGRKPVPGKSRVVKPGAYEVLPQDGLALPGGTEPGGSGDPLRSPAGLALPGGTPPAPGAAPPDPEAANDKWFEDFLEQQRQKRAARAAGSATPPAPPSSPAAGPGAAKPAQPPPAGKPPLPAANATAPPLSPGNKRVVERHAGWVAGKAAEAAKTLGVDQAHAQQAISAAMQRLLETNAEQIEVEFRRPDGTVVKKVLRRKQKPVGRTFSQFAETGAMFSMDFGDTNIAGAGNAVTMAAKPPKKGATVEPQPTDYTAHERNQFEKKIDAEPREASNHLVYADWLREHGEHDEADFRQAMGEWFSKGYGASLSKSHPWGYHHYGMELPQGVKESHVPRLGGVGNQTELWEDENSGPVGMHDPVVGFDNSGHGYGWPTYRHMEEAFRRAFMAGRKKT